MEDKDQHLYGALEENKSLTEKIEQKPGKCNAETKKAATNNIEECRVSEANKILINVYALKFEARNMIINKDTTVHICNACNKTLRRIQYMHIKRKVFIVQ